MTGRESSSVFLVEFLSYGSELAQLELGEAQAAPALGGADERTEHEFQHRLLAETVGKGLQPSTLLDEQSFEQIRRSNEAAMGDRQLQVGDAPLKQASALGRKVRVVGADADRQLARDRPRRRLIAT